ncbi:hypothetical protein Pan97_49960 [Bremerella volcania]|uniref:Uncharacterized protein n=1 Tax=Bremerella volcania TaxID=2527984 RepID=A0A518CFC0_9BACT|nr:hypothetical protein [Bremerella volcania]QDU77917.1 hypothetical protein Pan97_49960 [Bremerella volcania]
MNVNTYHHWKFTLVGGGIAALGIFMMSTSYLNLDAASWMSSAGVGTLVLGMAVFAYGVWAYLRHQPGKN